MQSIRLTTPSKSKANAVNCENIDVKCRIRPPSVAERNNFSVRCVEIQGRGKNEIKLTDRRKKHKTFSYNSVFGPKATQEEVYEDTVAPLLDEVLKGYSCTFFAYGQTGTGKTHTMEGVRQKVISADTTLDNLQKNNTCDKGAGIIPRAMFDIFRKLKSNPNTQFTVKVSMLELYNEQLCDLLSDGDLQKQNHESLKIFMDDKSGVPYITNVTELDVFDRSQVSEILQKGGERRRTAETKMNHASSRSHCIFQATVSVQKPGSPSMTTGRLYLVDLAGSENIGRSGAQGIRAKEAGNINKSLLTLNRCITNLISKQHVPYRESKLTQ